MTKYQTTPEHVAALAAIELARRLVESQAETLQRLVEAAERIETLGIVYAPTLMRDYIKSDNAQAQVRIANIAIKFLRDVLAEIENLPKGPEVGRG